MNCQSFLLDGVGSTHDRVCSISFIPNALSPSGTLFLPTFSIHGCLDVSELLQDFLESINLAAALWLAQTL